MDTKVAHLGISCLVAIGSNQEWIGNSSVIVLTELLHNFKVIDVDVTAISRFFRTPAFPVGSGPDFTNAAVMIRTNLTANDLLQKFHDIEAKLGRMREKRWGQRTADIDLIAFGDQILPSSEIQREWMSKTLSEQMTQTPTHTIVPHPRMQDRAFVLGPLMDIAPNWEHPVLAKTVRQMFFDLPKSLRDEITPLS